MLREGHTILCQNMNCRKSPPVLSELFDLGLKEFAQYGLITRYKFFNEEENNVKEAAITFEWSHEAKNAFLDRDRLKNMYGWEISFLQSSIQLRVSIYRKKKYTQSAISIPLEKTYLCKDISPTQQFIDKEFDSSVSSFIFSSRLSSRNLLFLNFQFDLRKFGEKGKFSMTRIQFNMMHIRELRMQKYRDKLCLFVEVRKPPTILTPCCDIIDFYNLKVEVKWELSTDYYESGECFGIENISDFSLEKINYKPIKIGFGYTPIWIFEINEIHYSKLCKVLQPFYEFEKEKYLSFMEREDKDDGREFEKRFYKEEFDYCFNKKQKNSKINIASTCPYLEDYEKIREYLKKLENNFDVYYLLESCFSNRILVREATNLEFYELLDSMISTLQYTFLRWISSRNRIIYDPIPTLKRFIVREKKYKERTILRDIIGLDRFDEDVVLSLLITPQNVILNPPKIDCGNRVLRRFPKHRSNFIRVKFACDEEGFYPSRNHPFQKLVKHYLENGLLICDRKYCFLVPSESQLRTGSCWFYSPLRVSSDLENKSPLLLPESLRNKLGNFESCGSVSKILARMGLCFSASYGVKGFPIKDSMWKEIEDVERGGHIFTDGCGKIDYSLFKRICEQVPYGKRHLFSSAVQVRFKGYKGMLTVFNRPEKNENLKRSSSEEKPKLKSKKVEVLLEKEKEKEKPLLYVRKSQRKFETQENTFDICYGSFSGWRPYCMNREVIMQLEARECSKIMKKLLKDIYETQEEFQRLSVTKKRIKKDLLNNSNKVIIEEEDDDYYCLSKEDYEWFLEELNAGRVDILDNEEIDNYLEELFKEYGKDIDLKKLKRKGFLWKKIIEYQDKMCENLDLMLKDENTALWCLQNYYFSRRISSSALFKAIENGMFHDIYIKKCLYSLSRSSKRLIQTKFNIWIKNGIKSFGVCDEFGVLEYNQVFVRVVRKSRNVKINEDFIVEGDVFITKNPCVHPGDGRILKAVNVLKNTEKFSEEAINWFSSLQNILVFSTEGDRPNPHELSGSDLDGDEYSVLFDENLIPKDSSNFEPCPYDDIKSIENEQIPLDGDDRLDKMIDFFLKYQRDYNLGEISNVHATHYGKSIFGILSPICRKLSFLHSLSVDSAKSGERVKIPMELQTDERPNFVKSFVPENKRFQSENLCGVLYSKMNEAFERSEKFVYPKKNFCDPDIIDIEEFRKIPNFKTLYRWAKSLKILFDEEISVICMQYKIRSESDLFTQGYVYYLGKFSVSVRSLEISVRRNQRKFRKYFRKICSVKKQKAGGKNEEEEVEGEEEEVNEYLELFFCQLWYYVTYCGGTPRKVSFAWINQEVLLKLKNLRIGKNQNELIEHVRPYLEDFSVLKHFDDELIMENSIME